MTDILANLGAARTKRPCPHPRSDRTKLPNGDSMCFRCERVIPLAKSLAGRRARKKGNRRELELAREMGGEKVGHHGGPDDVRMSMFTIQSKVRGNFPTWMTEELRKLPRSGGRVPVLIVTGPPGSDPEDHRRRLAIAVVYLSDWEDLHGEVSA